MKEKVNDVPLLDLAPKLKRPLSLWNPLDYLRLLFWVFFFPQAIRWYVDTFGNKDKLNKGKIKDSKELKKTVWGDPIWNKLKIQALITLLMAFTGMSIVLNAFTIQRIGFIVFLLHLPISTIVVLRNVALGLLIGLVLGMVTIMLMIQINYWVGGLAIILAIGMVPSVALGTRQYVFGAGTRVLSWTLVIIVFSLSVIVPLETSSIVVVIWSALFLIVASYFVMKRIPEYVLLTIYLRFYKRSKKIKCLPHLGRLVLLPLPGIQKQLENQLDTNWETGVKYVNQLLAFSLQLIPVVKALHLKLEQSSGDVMLSRISTLTIKPYDWKLIPALSIKPRRIYWKFKLVPHLNTLANTACAGFWYWHKKESRKAVEAFSAVRYMRYGAEIYNVAKIIDKGSTNNDMQTIAAMEAEMNWLNSLPDPELRPGTLKALRILHSVAGEARVALNARAILNRSTAFNRAVADLTKLIETGGSFCPEPEWPLIQNIARQWKEIFSRAGGVIGEEVLRQPVPNPYEGYSGLPVTGPSFTGRTGVMSQIETHWAVGGPMPVLILYGHRRMGKTSVLRNLAQKANPDNLYVYLDMQNVGWVEHTGQLLLDFAEAVHKIASGAGLDIGGSPDHADFSDLDIARRSFNTLLERIDNHMTETKRLVLAIDEFELIEQGIRDQRIDPGLLPYLRSINQQYRWLGLIFAGLHTLDEMGRDYRSSFYGQAHYLRLGYLTRKDALKLVTQPHPDFALEYEDALIDEIYRLTFGQPYLVQLLCWELVNRWNDRFLEKGESTPRELKINDLAPVLTPDFYQGAGYYFEGVWGNATENEQRLMRIIARYENKPLSQQELAAEAIKSGFPKEPQIMEETLELLSRHDIIASKETGIGFASELMRRWVHQQKP